MASKGSSDALTRTYATSLRTQVAYLSEARICEIARRADEINRYFVKAFEGERVNCEVYRGLMQLLNKFINKLFIIFEIDINKIILLIEFKDIISRDHKEIIY